MKNASRIFMILCFAAYGHGCEQAQTELPLTTKDILSADGKRANANTDSKNSPEENPQNTFTEESTDEEVENAVAIEPVPIGGAFLVCLEQQKGSSSTALCRLEDELEQRMAPPQSWQLTYYVQTAKEKISLVSKDIPMDDPIGFSWQVNLGKYRLANVMVEIYDTEKGTMDITAPILMDSKTMRPPAGQDPRGKKPR
ncbi:hypothetical protein [Oligoflexus tunisiensis]|uniref:hypothetical protein n=1 Tax=Oligoflexus tunisiensis TaxID=708132 RepID=UPI00114D04F4|nr:hypothetical protein [Oligoflexus tunisiensis]